eukprot:m51a1_g8318 putative nucleolar GTP-binding protein (700) ;mRNA; f:116816-119205
MVVYNFKRLTVVPTGKDLVDIVLSSTQRKTPTVVHKHYAVSRIRSFYARKVKFAQQTFHDRLSKILEEFPLLDDLHPFYADLLNVLYDKDHYKLALAQLSTARRLIDNVATETVRFLKFGDSLYRCKQLKRSALGRMCTIVKHQGTSLSYLEQVRQHLARLPSIDPNTRTIILTGYPNVGKSSLMNRLTRAQVDVQPYAFTTKSLFVGHTDYGYLRWQVLDTPGILDHPLEDRNTIEMQAVTALAHLRAAVLFVLDVSGSCGWTVREQLALFESIRPLFTGKPVVMALNKIDVARPESLPDAEREALATLEKQGVALVQMSAVTEEGVSEAKKTVCEMLLAQRTEQKLAGKRADTILGRLHLATPAPRDRNERPALIPESVVEAQQAKAEAAAEDEGEEAEEVADGLQADEDGVSMLKARRTEGGSGERARDARRRQKTRAQEELEQAERDREALAMGENPWTDYMKEREHYLVDNEEWRYDVYPEMINGKNVADFIDPDIETRLAELEAEEELLVSREAEEALSRPPMPSYDKDAWEAIRHSRIMARKASLFKKHGESKRIAGKTGRRDVESLTKHLAGLGVEPERADRAAKSIADRVGRKRTRSVSRPRPEELQALEDDGDDVAQESASKRRRSVSMSRPMATASEETHDKANRAESRGRKRVQKGVTVCESDRRIQVKMPKHLFSGKRGMGKTQRR